MDIRLTLCKRRTKCHYCEEHLQSGDEMLIGRYVKLKGERKWVKRYYWHPICWLNYQRGILDKEPPSPPHNKLALTDDKKAARLKILRHHAYISYQIRAAQKEGRIHRVAELVLRQAELADKIAQFGGVPKKWLQST